MRLRLATPLIAATFALGLLASPAAADPPPGHEHPCHPHAPANVIVGSFGNDRLPGTICDDVIYGLPGNDVLIGRAGNDTLIGGRGNDRLRSRDGEFDVVRCGAGFDRARVDRIDVTLRCEIVAT